MSSALAWLRRWGAALLGLLLVALGGGWLWQHERRKRLDAEAAAEVERLRTKIANAKAVRDRLLEDASDHDDAIRQLDESIDSNGRAILNAYEEPLEGLTRDEIRERLRRLGY